MFAFCPRLIYSLLKNIFPTLRKTQLANLSLGVLGLVRSRSGMESEIAREVPGSGKHKHRLKRFWRFLSNPRIKPEELRSFWVSWCLRKFTAGKNVLVALDWTTLPGNIQVLMLAIPYQGRAIPILWHLCLFTDIKDSQNKIEERLIVRLVNLISSFNLFHRGKGKKLILVADRGFGRASFIQFLKKRGISFAIRVKSEVWIKVRSGKKILLKDLYLKPNFPYWFEDISFRSDEVVTDVNLAAIFIPRPGKDPDPWFLITNLKKAKTAINYYLLRFDIEEWFKDLKHQLGITDLRIRNLKRVRRLLLTACVAYSFTALIGQRAKKIRKVVDDLIARGKETASIIWIALKAIGKRLLSRQFWKRIWVLGVKP